MACSDGLPTPQNLVQWEFQDPTDGATSTYHISAHILSVYPLKFRPYIGLIYGEDSMFVV
jgi:hypothetical protein